MKKKLGLTTKIFIGLILGAICGIILYGLVPAGVIRDDILINGIFKVFGKGFLRGDANACCTISILLISLWEYGYR